MKKAYLVLEDGHVFEGFAFGAEVESVGELVFNTGVVGYVETITDPSYYGQIVLQTFPLIGNYGVAPEDIEGKSYLRGYVVREWCNTPSNFRSQYDIDKLLKDEGIQLLYHNHDFEFQKLDGEIILDKLYTELGAELINPELDTCWVHYAGADPVEYINKYADRSKIVHLKDFSCKELGAGPNYALIDENGNEIKPKSREENEFKFQPLGQGRQNMPAILEACDKAVTEYIIVEQDQSLDRAPLEAVKMSREYLKTLGQ